MTNRIINTLTTLRTAGRKALIPYMTPEFPLPGSTLSILHALEKAGADLIEVGIPFSDPLADGPTIQRSSMVAIQNGVTLKGILSSVKSFRQESDVPIIFMGYSNPIVHFGIEKFCTECRAAGVDGLIVPDLPPEESEHLRREAKAAGIDVIFLVAPTSTPERIRTLDALTSGFLYCVSITGVTGSRHDIEADTGFRKFLDTVRENATKPFLVGFGISSRSDVEYVWRFADGAIVGSALIHALEECTTVEGCARRAEEFITSLIPGTALRREGTPS